MNYTAIIPARYGSSRFPGKPLTLIEGLPMIKRVYDSVISWGKWKYIYLATDDLRIAGVCKEHGIPYMMTRDNHTDCLDRAAEVVELMEDLGQITDRYIVIQGDEPLFNTDTLNVDLSPEIVNFYTEVQDQDDKYDANAVKVVISKSERCLYFSRYSVPYHDVKTKRSDEEETVYKQIGVYSFSGERLKEYTSLSPSYLENMEGIGLNRLIENDIDIHMRYTPYDSISVDTPEDKERIAEIIRNQNSQRETSK